MRRAASAVVFCLLQPWGLAEAYRIVFVRYFLWQLSLFLWQRLLC